MKRIHVVGLALCAVFAFCSFAASSAFAGTEWLIGGKPVLTPTSVESEGELLICDEKGGITGGKACIHCSGLDFGFVGAGPKDEVTDLTNLAGTSLNVFTECTNDEGCPEVDKVEELNLPWKTELVLMENGEILDLLSNGGYEVTCLALGVEVKDTCTATDEELDVENMPAEKDVLLEFLFAELGTGNSCTRGGANSGKIEGFDLVFTLNGEELSASVV